MKTFRFTLLITLLLAASFACAQKSPISACSLHAIVASDTSSGALEMIPIPTQGVNYIYVNGSRVVNPRSPSIHICSLEIRVKQPGSAPASFGLVTGTGTNCATGQASLTTQWAGTISVTDSWSPQWASDIGPVAPAGTAVCLLLSTAPTAAQAYVTYGVF
jgi:hypothetical protein